MNYKNQTMDTTTILDLPTEIFITAIFKYLNNIDIYHLGESGSKRLKGISEYIVGNLGKFFNLFEIILCLIDANK